MPCWLSSRPRSPPAGRGASGSCMSPSRGPPSTCRSSPAPRCLRHWRRDAVWAGPTVRRSDGQEFPSVLVVGGTAAQLGHGPQLDLADSFPADLEILADLLEGVRIDVAESKAHGDDLALPTVEE